MRYVELNSGVLKVSISPWMNYLSNFFSSVFWFSLSCLALLRSCWRGGYILYTDSYCGSLEDAWRITGYSGSDSRACLSSKVYGLS